MRAYLLAVGAALALSGCQSAEQKRAAETGEIEVSNGSMEQITALTKAARPKSKLQPGLWHTELRVVSADLSAFPVGEARDAQLAAIKGQERTATGCRTADDLKPFDIDNLEKVAGTCTFPRYLQKGGKLDVQISCGDGATKTVMVATGTLGPTGYDVTIDQTSGTPGAAGYLGLKLEAKGSRTGNCIAKAAG
jgi:hypothetical protein